MVGEGGGDVGMRCIEAERAALEAARYMARDDEGRALRHGWDSADWPKENKRGGP